MKGALSFTTIVLGMSAASAFVGFEIQHTGSRTFRVTKQIGLQRMASAAPAESDIPDSVMEEVWRYVKKPLISVGGKGATNKHGNSLRQLLNDHTAVKVKVNTKSFGTLENAYESLRDLAIESGASQDIELIQMREKDRIIMFGLPGTLENVKDGSFPPQEEEDDDGEDDVM